MIKRALIHDLIFFAVFLPSYLAGWFDARREFRRTSPAHPSSTEGIEK